jgi:hypothetical protein
LRTTGQAASFQAAHDEKAATFSNRVCRQPLTSYIPSGLQNAVKPPEFIRGEISPRATDLVPENFDSEF